MVGKQFSIRFHRLIFDWKQQIGIFVPTITGIMTLFC
jgi:hypothetical protein